MKIVLKNVIVSFPRVYAKDQFGNYSSRFLIDNDSPSDKLLGGAIETVGQEKFKDKWPATKSALVAAGKFPLHQGDAAKHHSYANRIYINSKSDLAPLVADREGKLAAEDQGLMYSGAIVNAHLDISAYENKYGKFVSIRLLGIQFVKDGERLASAPTADIADFTPIVAEDNGEL